MHEVYMEHAFKWPVSGHCPGLSGLVFTWLSGINCSNIHSFPDLLIKYHNLLNSYVNWYHIYRKKWQSFTPKIWYLLKVNSGVFILRSQYPRTHAMKTAAGIQTTQTIFRAQIIVAASWLATTVMLHDFTVDRTVWCNKWAFTFIVDLLCYNE